MKRIPHLRLLVLPATVLLLGGCALFRAVGILPPPGADEYQAGDSAQVAYEKGKRLFAAEAWDEAEDAFNAVWTQFPQSPLAGDARFYEADSKYGKGKYNAAYERYKSYLKRHPLSPHGPLVQRRLYDMGVYTIETGKEGFLGLFPYSDEGVQMLDYLVAVFPNGDLADDALVYAAAYESEDEQWLDAIGHLSDLIEFYPGSEWSIEARLRLARAYRALNRGSSYDADALNRALAQYSAYLEQVGRDPRRATEYADLLDSARREAAEIREILARKGVERADYYLKTEHPDAAQQTLKNVVREYPGTMAAGEARTRLGISKPENPGDPGPTDPGPTKEAPKP